MRLVTVPASAKFVDVVKDEGMLPPYKAEVWHVAVGGADRLAFTIKGSNGEATFAPLDGDTFYCFFN